MNKLIPVLAALVLLIAGSCKNTSNTDEEAQTEVKTPVTVTSVEHSGISEYIQLTAVSGYLKKNQVKTNVTGFIEKSLAHVGDFVEAGKPLFYIRTREAEALRKFHSTDSAYSFKGIIIIKAPESGILTEVIKFINDYVTDGDAMATIAQKNSFVFLLNVPYELKKYASVGSGCILLLPDSTRLDGRIFSQLSTVDPVSQTQSYEVKVSTGLSLPENLLATVQLVKSTKQNAQVVDKSCILSDETMENFWVMKLINDSTAVKVPVTKGISTNERFEILSPQFSPDDRILKTGQYGLSDTAYVHINK